MGASPSGPERRAGILGMWDWLVGPGASAAENAVTLIVAPVAAALAVWLLPAGASTLQQALAAVLAFDVIAGVWVMSTPAARRWYHRPGRSLASRWAFAFGHVHPFVIAVVFELPLWPWAGCLYAGMVTATVGLGLVPRRLRAPAAALVVVVVLTIDAMVGGGPLVWFAPAYMMKLVIGHLLPDHP